MKKLIAARYILFNILICLILSGCGQSGHLYLPTQPAPQTTPKTGTH